MWAVIVYRVYSAVTGGSLKHLYKMKLVNRVSAFQDFEFALTSLSKNWIQKVKIASQRKLVFKTQWLRFVYGIMMIMPNEESEWVHQLVLYILTMASFFQLDNGDFEAGKNVNGCLKWQIVSLVFRCGRRVCTSKHRWFIISSYISARRS